MKGMKYTFVLLLALGCAPYLSEDGGRCPCKDGWKCCNDHCILEQSICNSGGDGGTDAGDVGIPGLLASCHSSSHGTSSPARDQIVFYLAYNTSGVGCMSGLGLETPHSGHGTTIFDAGSGAEFADFVVCMTNGIDDDIDSGSRLYPPGSGSYGLYAESEFWKRSPDFAGCEIDRIRLIVSSLSLVPDGDSTNVDAEWVWEVWGDCGGGD
jgi:hypothetical protein